MKTVEVPADVWPLVEMMARETERSSEDIFLVCLINGLSMTALGGSRALRNAIAEVALAHDDLGEVHVTHLGEQ
jgi:hypothetical protein